MPTVDDLRNSNYLKQSDVDPPVLVTVDHWEKVNMAKEGAEADVKFVLHFRELDKPMSLNYTNGSIIHQISGSGDMDNWPGTKIVLYVDPNVMFGGKMVGGIRVRAPRNQAQPPATQPSGPNPDYVGDNPPPPQDDTIPF